MRVNYNKEAVEVRGRMQISLLVLFILGSSCLLREMEVRAELMATSPDELTRRSAERNEELESMLEDVEKEINQDIDDIEARIEEAIADIKRPGPF